jgi:F420-non-reducing hydrogenase iron-sulfur subunit
VARSADPKIVALVCSWHPLTSADNAGADGCGYSSSTTVVPVDCAGCVSAAAILRAFARGASGVLVAACGQGDCHYTNGNESCERVVGETRELLALAGFDPARLRFDLSSEVDGGRFATLVTEFATEIATLDAANGSGGKPASGKAKRRAPKKRAVTKTKRPAKKTKRMTKKTTPAAEKTKRAVKKTNRVTKKTKPAAKKKPAARKTKRVTKKTKRARAKR